MDLHLPQPAHLQGPERYKQTAALLSYLSRKCVDIRDDSMIQRDAVALARLICGRCNHSDGEAARTQLEATSSLKQLWLLTVPLGQWQAVQERVCHRHW
jgi:hypothetical protein